ncbi:MAG: glutamine--tRNA ligase/YqeY domain fusion protein [Clostridia bacterium]|nr:glutamine--tRNA ligase/YqeY domain fusion protein [Clostridia bacterium]
MFDAENFTHFITDIIDSDLKEGRVDKVATRFPPEPNGYLHIGSAKAIFVNYLAAKRYGGSFNLRYDDTNPSKEDNEYVESIYEDISWLTGEEPKNVFFGSDYFEKCYEYAVKLIKDGKAYVCDLSSDEMKEYRGTLTEPGKESPYRNRSVEENLKLFEEMRAGKYKDGEKTLRAKIDMASPNINMRDPAIYRITRKHHHRQGDKWCIYPLYDYAHPLQDAIEGITHSCCSIEFENHRPLYDWVVENTGVANKPHQYEFARLNVTNVVMSKRYLRKLVEDKFVSGWDDPRMPTLSGLRRRGFTPTAIYDFIRRAGVAKTSSLVDHRLLDHCQRDELNRTAERRIAVLDPVKVTVTNYEEGKTEYFKVPNRPQDENTDYREIPFTKTLYIDRSDFAEVPPPKFQRLTVGKEVRLMGSYIVRCDDIVKDENGVITEILCTADLVSGNGNPFDGRKIKGTIHWISASHAVPATFSLLEPLFNIENTSEIAEGYDFEKYLTENSLVTVKGYVEPSLANALKDGGERFQFVRTGYFIADKKSGAFIRTVTLKDGYKPE